MDEEMRVLAEEYISVDADGISERLELESLRYSRQLGDSGVTTE